MTLPLEYHNMALPVRSYLQSYWACRDCKYAIDELSKKLEEERLLFWSWKIQYAGILSLMKASIHLMGKVDTKSCVIPQGLKDELKKSWNQLKENKPEYPIFWEFIDKERNNILKQYKFSANQALLCADGSIKKQQRYSLLTINQDDEKEILVLSDGRYSNKNAVSVLYEASDWLENYIMEAIRRAGYNPEQDVVASTFKPPVNLSTVEGGRFGLLNLKDEPQHP